MSMTASPLTIRSLSLRLSTCSTATRKAIRADLRSRITEEKSKRLFYALYPDENQVWQAPANKHFNPGETVYARALYPKHLEFFRAGRGHRERCLMAANRTGKTLGGVGYETACHQTGGYHAGLR